MAGADQGSFPSDSAHRVCLSPRSIAACRIPASCGSHGTLGWIWPYAHSGHQCAGIEERIGAFAIAGAKGAIVVPPHALTLAQRGVIVGLAMRHQLPGVYGDRSFAESGGLISFGINMADQLRRVATYVDVILKGAKPAELPVQLPTKYEMLVNLKTATALGLTVPPSVLAR